MTQEIKTLSPQCGIPLSRYERILLGHGSGGKLTQQLIDDIFLPAFQNEPLEALQDGALLEMPSKKIAFTTDSYVVHPLFFSGRGYRLPCDLWNGKRLGDVRCRTPLSFGGIYFRRRS